MRIAIGSDHRGYGMKVKLAEVLGDWGHTVTDEGTDSTESCDYPDVAAAVARKVSAGESDRDAFKNQPRLRAAARGLRFVPPARTGCCARPQRSRR